MAGLLAAIGQAVTGSNSESLLEVFSEPGLWAGMLLTVVLVSRHYGTGSLSRDFGLAGKVSDVGWGALAFVTMLVLASAVVGVFSGTRYAGSNTQILLSQKSNGLHYAVVAAVVAVGAPFFEELFFRGFLRTALSSRFGPHGAIFAQAALFGAAHAGEVKGYANVSIVLAMFTLGVVLGYTAKLTGRLGAGMVAHCLFNLAAVISLA
jgi:membrane protease YdiL (CAAX protease family)